MSTALPLSPPWPFRALAPALGFLEEVDGVLTAPELEQVSRRVADSGQWREYVVERTDLRDYRLVFENEHIDVWVLSWMPGQTTGFHDHDVSEVGIAIVQGAVREAHMTLGGAPVDHVLRAGDTQQGGYGYIHRVSHEAGRPAVSIHAYSPVLRTVGQYRQRDGRMIRLPEPGRTRLTPG